MVKAYSGALILADVLLLLLKTLYSICESIYRLIVPVEEKSVNGEIVLVTGAGHGIGKELALQYASLGATVVCWDVNKQGNEETVKEINKLGATSAHSYKCDVTNRDEVFAVAEKVKKEVGHVTILINNAGIMPCHSLFNHTPEQIGKLFEVNVFAHFWTLQAFLPDMIEKNHGHVVALSSLAGIIGIPNLVPYCASKFAVRGIMEATQAELRAANSQNMNIKFTTICPYMVDTGLCKKPKTRFPSAMALVPPKEAAAQIIKAQRKEMRSMSIPRSWQPINNVLRNFPDKVSGYVQDFLDSGVEADS